MSGTKRSIEQREARWNAAVAVAIAAKVLRQCEFHPDIVLCIDGADITNAYKVGNAKFSAGEFDGVFESRTQMTDTIQSVVQDHPLEDCPRCDKLLED